MIPTDSSGKRQMKSAFDLTQINTTDRHGISSFSSFNLPCLPGVFKNNGTKTIFIWHEQALSSCFIPV